MSRFTYKLTGERRPPKAREWFKWHNGIPVYTVGGYEEPMEILKEIVNDSSNSSGFASPTESANGPESA